MITQLQPLTAQDLRETLKSKENKLALKAIELISSSAPLEDLKTLVASGCAKVAYERNPIHPRKSYLTHYVLDTCFVSQMGVLETTEDDACTTTSLGPVHASEGREAHFDYLLSQGFPEGSNGYRGSLFRHILSSCFYDNREQARKFARILAKHKPEEVKLFAENDYSWVSHPEHLDFVLSLGVDPDINALVDTALTYFGCCNKSDASPTGRRDTLAKLLSMGAKPSKVITGVRGSQSVRRRIIEGDLLKDLAALGVVTLANPPEYSAWLHETEKDEKERAESKAALIAMRKKALTENLR